jgi:transcriptional regulator with XRE-family HTH domain
MMNIAHCRSIRKMPILAMVSPRGFGEPAYMKKPRIEDVLGHTLYLARVDRRISQEKLAEMADIDRSTLSDVERGESRPSIFFYIRVSHALGSAPGEMLDGVIAQFLADGGKLGTISGRMKQPKGTAEKHAPKASTTRALGGAKKARK